MLRNTHQREQLSDIPCMYRNHRGFWLIQKGNAGKAMRRGLSFQLIFYPSRCRYHGVIYLATGRLLNNI